MILNELRRSTEPYHRRLETNLDIRRRCSDRQSYIRLLQRLYGYIDAVEVLLYTHAEWNEDEWQVERRRKSPLLKSDLSLLGMSEQDIERLQRCAELPRACTFPAAVGVLYVFEGSTLGGQMISPLIESSLGIHGGNGAGYFWSYGEDVGRMWALFRRSLTRYATEANSQEIVASAVETFIRLDQWLCDESERLAPAKSGYIASKRGHSIQS